mmetsp:Transcript_21898/g.27993  ORF Transcript_21898/g.27993 Transcript_21898/m.27993 type:complete len:123 (+) Transcript_21898:1148-1516(+)
MVSPPERRYVLITQPSGNSGPAGPEETSVAEVILSPVARHNFLVSFLSFFLTFEEEEDDDGGDGAGLFFFFVATLAGVLSDAADVVVLESSSIANTVDEALEPTVLRDGPDTRPLAPLPPPT